MSDGPSATVGEIIDRAPISGLQRTVFALCLIVSILDGFDTQAIAFVAPAIAREWQVSQWHFGFVFSATLLGSVIGSSVCGVLADRIGRRKLLIATTLIFGLFSGACAIATDYWELLAFRLIGGFGMGGAVPNMLALTAEYAPRRQRTTIVTFILWGFPFGAVLGGLASAPLISHFGWQSVFWLGAAAPLLLVPLLIRSLPESLTFLAIAGSRRGEIVTLLRRIDPKRADSVVLDNALVAITTRGHVSALFTEGLAAPTILLSTVIFLSLFVTYLLINWVPTLLTRAGLSVSSAILGAVALNLGGIFGSYVMSRAVDGHARPPLVLAGGYACGAVMIALTGGGTGTEWFALAMLLACGFFHIGTQLSTSAYASDVYPVALRGTGLGTVQAIGRLGSLVGPIVGGALLSAGMTTAQLFLLAMIPAGLAGLALLALALLRSGKSATEAIE